MSRELTNELGEFITSIDFTDEQIAAVKEAVDISKLVICLFLHCENASTNYLTIASDTRLHCLWLHINWLCWKVERLMLVAREFADEKNLQMFNY